MIRELLTMFALWLIEKVNKNKDRMLAYDLYKMALEYDPNERAAIEEIFDAMLDEDGRE